MKSCNPKQNFRLIPGFVRKLLAKRQAVHVAKYNSALEGLVLSSRFRDDRAFKSYSRRLMASGLSYEEVSILVQQLPKLREMREQNDDREIGALLRRLPC